MIYYRQNKHEDICSNVWRISAVLTALHTQTSQKNSDVTHAKSKSPCVNNQTNAEIN